MDCNRNDIWDDCDIDCNAAPNCPAGCGGSLDHNLNGVPDECDGADVWYVDAAATGTGSGAKWVNAFTDLQDAIAVAGGSSNTVTQQIWVKGGGTYTPGTARTDSFELANDIELYGGFAGTEINLSQRGDPSLNPTILSGNIGRPVRAVTTRITC